MGLLSQVESSLKVREPQLHFQSFALWALACRRLHFGITPATPRITIFLAVLIHHGTVDLTIHRLALVAAT